MKRDIRVDESDSEIKSIAKEKVLISQVPSKPHGNPKSQDSSSHTQRVTLKQPHKSISTTRKVHIACKECVRVCVSVKYVCVCVCARLCSHLWLQCALASGTRLTPESRGADRDRPIRINYSGHTQGLLAHFTVNTYSLEDWNTHTHTNIHMLLPSG